MIKSATGPEQVNSMRMRALFCFFLATIAFVIPVASSAEVSVGISVRIGPPVLPVYVQPPCPEPGWIWTPGYWAWGPEGYYWVPGAWVAPPAVGLLWTPGYWGWGTGVYIWHPGYWGPHVGFYGGINYGFGYTGVGFFGGYWRGNNYFYNRSVTNVNVVNIHNTYINNTVVNNTTVNRVSFNGGNGGTTARPTQIERQYANERHVEATSLQAQHEHLASNNRALLASSNHGQPPIAATSRAGEFSGKNVVAARGVNNNYHSFNSGNNNNLNRGNNKSFNGGNNNTASRGDKSTFRSGNNNAISHNNPSYNPNNSHYNGSANNKNYARTNSSGGPQGGGSKGGNSQHRGQGGHERDRK